MGTISVPSRTLCPTVEVANGDFCFLTERDWGQESCYGNSTKDVILFLLWCTCTFMVPSFKNTASIFPEISFIQYFPHFSCKQWRHHWSNLHNRKTSIFLKRKKIFQKEKHQSSVFWKGFQISTNYFSLHRHFNNTNFFHFLLKCSYYRWKLMKFVFARRPFLKKF